jgi:tRNA dimethylallyltransferase
MDHHHGPDPNAQFPVLAILAPTASGKSRLALGIAERVGGEIISVDALKVYRGMDAGTAKPTALERARVPHHGLDLIEPHEEFSVAAFLDYAEPLLAEIVARRRVPILDVTAPYYLKALVYGIERGPGPQKYFRAGLADRPARELYEALLARDPVAAARIGPADHKRLVRALEILEFSNRLPSEAKAWGEPRDDYRWVFTGIRWPRAMLYERLRQRALTMFDAGWLEEVRLIHSAHGFSRTAGLAHGYRRISQYIDGLITWAECVEETIRDVKRFARKSMTFFKGFPRVQWLEVTTEEELDRAAAYLSHELKDMLRQCGVTPDSAI